MLHKWETFSDHQNVEYKWKKNDWHHFKVTAHQALTELSANSEEEFITEHYWGYTKLNSTKTSEYAVEHPKWKMYRVKEHTIDVDFGAVYGSNFSFLTNQQPRSVMLAEGSEIIVSAGRHL